MKKRGVSPLIATVLLVGMVIAAAGIILLFSKDITKEITEKSGAQAQAALNCAKNIKINILGVRGDAFEVENSGNTKIDRFLLRLKQGDSVVPIQAPNSVEPGEATLVSYSGHTFDEASIVPMVNVGGNVYAPCSKRAETYAV